jgi:hypothetical protein
VKRAKSYENIRFWNPCQTLLSATRFDVSTVVKIQVQVFWVVTSCTAVGEYQHFGGPFCLHFRVKFLQIYSSNNALPPSTDWLLLNVLMQTCEAVFALKKTA